MILEGSSFHFKIVLGRNSDWTIFYTSVIKIYDVCDQFNGMYSIYLNKVDVKREFGLVQSNR